jgi:hypothetical protein
MSATTVSYFGTTTTATETMLLLPPIHVLMFDGGAVKERHLQDNNGSLNRSPTVDNMTGSDNGEEIDMFNTGMQYILTRTLHAAISGTQRGMLRIHTITIEAYMILRVTINMIITLDLSIVKIFVFLWFYS